MTLDFTVANKPRSALQYWTKLKLPAELHGLNMRQLTTLRRMVQAAYNAGKQNAGC